MPSHTTAFLVDETSLYVIARATPVPPIKELLDRSVFARDMQDGGFYQIVATVKIDDTPTDIPIHREVHLFAEPGMRKIRSTWSDPVTGAYQFDNLKGGVRYSVLATDYAHNYRAVVADNLLPTAMP